MYFGHDNICKVVSTFLYLSYASHVLPANEINLCTPFCESVRLFQTLTSPEVSEFVIVLFMQDFLWLLTVTLPGSIFLLIESMTVLYQGTTHDEGSNSDSLIRKRAKLTLERLTKDSLRLSFSANRKHQISVYVSPK